MTLHEVQPDGRVHELRFVPGYDLRATGHGIHGLQLLFLLRPMGGKPTWALTCEITTGWLPSTVREAWSCAGEKPFAAQHCTGYSSMISWHTAVQLDIDTEGRNCCDWLDGQRCYSGSTGLVRQVFVDFVEQGESVVWDELNRRADLLVVEIEQAQSDARNFS